MVTSQSSAAVTGSNAEAPKAPTVIGNAASNFWLFDPANGFDLTHPTSPGVPLVKPHIKLLTTTMPVTIAPEMSALVIIDMQNLFLSMGVSRGPGHDAMDKLLSLAIPAARKAKIQIIHITWGITEEELAALPPVLFRSFGYTESEDSKKNLDVGPPLSLGGPHTETKRNNGVGGDLGDVKLPNGSTIPEGRFLMRDQWNTALHRRLQDSFDQSQTSTLPDVRFDKCRISGFWGGSTLCLEYLKDKGIKTLLFSGVNTDQCVLSSLQDACNMGFDTILLKDACGTSSPDYARRMVEYNCRQCWGFVSDCQSLVDGVSLGIWASKISGQYCTTFSKPI